MVGPAVSMEAHATLRTRVDGVMRRLIAGRALPAALGDAMAYAALGPGKRVRPVLAYLSYSACGGVWHGHDLMVDRAAAAVEFVHAFSLVHDDLPAMDDDDLRRGRPTLHRHTSEAMAVLAGDGLLTLALEVLSVGDDPALSCALSAELASATSDMIAGQVYDTLPDARNDGAHEHDADRLLRTHRLKTGALLRSACRMGGRCAGADAQQLEALRVYAEAIGLMFQAVDDLLDETGDASAMGKAARKDADAGKLTYPLVFGLDRTRAHIAALRHQAEAALQPFGAAGEPLRTLAVALAERER